MRSSMIRAAALVAVAILAGCATDAVTVSAPETVPAPEPLPPAQWELTDQVAKFLSTTTKDMGDVQCTSMCEYCSPEGKYCASAAYIRGSAPKPDADFEYRFARPEGDCHNYVVAIGPGGGPGDWNQPIICSMTPDQTYFEAVIIGWTHPQAFRMTIPLERRRR